MRVQKEVDVSKCHLSIRGDGRSTIVCDGAKIDFEDPSLQATLFEYLKIQFSAEDLPSNGARGLLQIESDFQTALHAKDEIASVADSAIASLKAEIETARDQVAVLSRRNEELENEISRLLEKTVPETSTVPSGPPDGPQGSNES